MHDKFFSLTEEFVRLCEDGGLDFAFGIINDFIERHDRLKNGSKIDGLPGLLNYVKYVYANKEPGADAKEKRSLFEVAALLWKLEKLGRIDLAEVLLLIFIPVLILVKRGGTPIAMQIALGILSSNYI